MAGIEGNDSAGPSPADVDAIDALLREGAPMLIEHSTPTSNHANLPQKIDIVGFFHAMEKSREPLGERSQVLIPAYFSERERRLALARSLAKTAVETIGQLCVKEEGKHHCPSVSVCALVDRSKEDPAVLDHVAAAILMPTNDISRWGGLLDWKDSTIANNYAVPIELAQLRRLDIQAMGTGA